MITGETQVAAVVGWPARHSLSPTILNAAFAALDLDWVYLAFDVPEGQAADAVAAMRSLGLGGLSVTMPHKAAVQGAVDECTAVASALGAVNCVFRRDGLLVGDNTDGAGFVDSLRAEGIDVGGLRCVVVGAGGAGRAVARALGEAGTADVAVVNRTPEAAVRAAALAGPVGRVGSAADVTGADLVVNATSVGMGVRGPGDPVSLPVDAALLGPGHVVVDLIYHPAETPLLAAARRGGAVGFNGVGMLVHQAAHAFARWTGEAAPIDVMVAATRRELARRARVDSAP